MLNKILQEKFMSNFLLALFTFIFITASVQAETVKGGYFIIVYNKSDVLADIRINDIPVITMDKKDSVSGQMDVNYWIFPGKNKIAINLIEQKKKDATSFYNPQLKCMLYIGQKGQFPEEGKPIYKFEWSEKKDDEKITGTDKKQNYPYSKTFEFEPEFVPPSDLWSKAEPINITEKDKIEIISLLKNFETSFNTRNLENLFHLTEFRGIDTSKSRYYQITKDQMMNDLKSLTPDKTFKIKNNSNGKYKFIKLFSGQIYLVTSSTDKSPLVFISKDGSGDIDVYVSKINGKWILSR
jgi:hypothetical protein